MEPIINFYEKYDEESRLTTNNARRIEFILTTSALDQFIKREDRILELGAGTGVYSFYFAEKGNPVVATDITPKHVEIINQKLKAVEKEENINLQGEVVNATDLSRFDSENFDTILCLGPMYHLTNENDRHQCLKEALRTLRKGGLLAIAYINKHFVLNSVMTRNKNYLTKDFVDKILDTGVIREGEKECFWTDAFFTTPVEMESLLQGYNVEILDHLATDGITPYLRDDVDQMDEEGYRAWIYYLTKSCREKRILGMSNHGLLICRKR